MGLSVQLIPALRPGGTANKNRAYSIRADWLGANLVRLWLTLVIPRLRILEFDNGMKVPTLTLAMAAVAAALPLMAAARPASVQSSQASAAQASSTKKLTLQDVAAMTLKNNGTVKSAIDNYFASREGVVQAFAAFLPQITPSYVYSSQRQSNYASGQTFFSQGEGGTAAIMATWKLLDTGERSYQWRAAKSSAEGQRQNALQTLRQTLFNSEQQYYETLRAQELKLVAEAEVARAQVIYDQTKLNIDKGGAAKIAIYQVEADLDNAQVTLLQSQNAISTASAALKSLIGFPAGEELPPLENIGHTEPPASVPTLKSLLNEGVQNRPDLKSQRLGIDSLHDSTRLQELQAGLTLSVDASWDQILTPHTLQDRILTFSASYPLFDGGASRAAARSAGYQERSARDSYKQSVADAKSQIEAAYLTYTQNAKRVGAAQKAFTASDMNYKNVQESYHLGSSSLLDVLTAQVSLATAHSNLIQAQYDYAESDLSLRLATGRPLPSETAETVPR